MTRRPLALVSGAMLVLLSSTNVDARQSHNNWRTQYRSDIYALGGVWSSDFTEVRRTRRHRARLAHRGHHRVIAKAKRAKAVVRVVLRHPPAQPIPLPPLRPAPEPSVPALLARRHAAPPAIIAKIETTVLLPQSDLLRRARRYLGTNPTGRAHLWCARFMAMIAPELAKRVRNPNLARDWAVLPKSPPAVGAIVVLARGPKGGHIGVVSGFDHKGNPRVVSGNHGHRVGEGVYPKRRVLAYVSASL